MSSSDKLPEQQQRFNAAMQRYTSLRRYTLLGHGVSLLNVSLQIISLYLLREVSIGPVRQLAALAAAYLLADLVNGLVHMYMDNNDRYDSIDGPLIANFHLHHKVPQYNRRPLPVVYFMESGSKVWLVPCQLLVLVLLLSHSLNGTLLHMLVYFGIWSSVAEVSHYLCHTSTSRLSCFLGDCGLLLSKRHHALHHLQDNRSYAFLNGCSDPLLDLIAARFCGGYKQRSDLHFARYDGVDAESR